MIHDISGLEEENMVYRPDCVLSRSVLMSRYQFLRHVRDVSRRDSRLDSKELLYLGGSCSSPCKCSVVIYVYSRLALVMSSRASPSCFIQIL